MSDMSYVCWKLCVIYNSNSDFARIIPYFFIIIIIVLSAGNLSPLEITSAGNHQSLDLLNTVAMVTGSR